MDARRERIGADDEVQRRQATAYSLSCRWFVYDPDTTTTDDVYDEGPQRRYVEVPQPVRLLWALETEGENERTPDGRYLARKFAAGVSVTTLERSGVPDPEDTPRRLNDVVMWEGKPFRIDVAEPNGHLERKAMTVRLQGTEIFDWDIPQETDLLVI